MKDPVSSRGAQIIDIALKDHDAMHGLWFTFKVTLMSKGLEWPKILFYHSRIFSDT